jgi:hypothetical protein
MAFPRATEIAHLILKSRISTGDHVVDATVGNGHDTVFLAECVGVEGRVDGFDVQKEAIERTLFRIGTGSPQVFLHHSGHENIASLVPPGIKAVMFNLGYFPSGDKSIITRPETTVQALDASRSLLREDGLISILIYPGHAGGDAEADAVESWIDGLDENRFHSIRYGPSRRSRSPYLIAIERRNRVRSDT